MKKQTIIGVCLVIALLAVCYVLMNQIVPLPDDTDENNATPTLTIPGKSHFGASKSYLSSNSGETEAGKNITFILRLEKNKEAIRNETITVSRVKGKYGKYLDDELPLPNGMSINCIPSVFRSYPGKVYNVTILVNTTREVPEEIYFFKIRRNFDSGYGEMWIGVQVTAPALSSTRN